MDEIKLKNEEKVELANLVRDFIRSRANVETRVVIVAQPLSIQPPDIMTQMPLVIAATEGLPYSQTLLHNAFYNITLNYSSYRSSGG